MPLRWANMIPFDPEDPRSCRACAAIVEAEPNDEQQARLPPHGPWPLPYD